MFQEGSRANLHTSFCMHPFNRAMYIPFVAKLWQEVKTVVVVKVYFRDYFEDCNLN